MTSANTSGRRASRPVDPLFTAKRKRLLAEEYIATGTHAAIKKTIAWGDMTKGVEDRSPNKRLRLSQSLSVTPGISDMSTPTPINRPSLQSALKSVSRTKSAFNSPKTRPSSQPRKSVVVVSPHRSGGKMAHSQPELAPRMPEFSAPAPRKVQTQPEVIDIVSEETSEGDDREPEPPANQGLPHEPVRSPSPQILGSPTSDAGTQYREEDIHDSNEWLNPHTSPARAATLPVLRSAPRPISTQHERAASPTSPNRDDSASPGQSPPRLPTPEAEPTQADQASRKRRTSEVGIQTVPDNQVDWLAGLDVDESMSAIDVSRVWVDHISPKKARSGPDNTPMVGDHEDEDEPLAGNLLDQFEGEMPDRQDDGLEGETEGLGAPPEEQPGTEAVPDAQTGLDQLEKEYEEAEPDHIVGGQEQVPISPEPIPRQSSPASPFLLGGDRIRVTDPEPPVSLPSSFPRKSAISQPAIADPGPDTHNITSRMPATQPGGQPYPFKFQERKAEVAAESHSLSRVPTTTTAQEAGDPQERAAAASPLRPISSSQPNAFAPRARSRLYTPQPGPAPRPSQELRSAATLGRSMLRNEAAARPTASGTPNTEQPAKMNPSLRMVKADPTLGRSTEWKDAISPNPTSSQKGKAKAIDAPSPGRRSIGAASGVATDYDAEYGSIPEVSSSLPAPNSRSASRGHTPMMVSSSPSRYAWELEPSHTSTPRFHTRLSPTIIGSIQEEAQNESAPATEKRQPSPPLHTKSTSLAALDKRRRSSVAPSSQQSSSLPTKKIRREYDTPESTATPHPRAHKDTHDEFGRRTWVPHRPRMKRAPEGTGTNKVIRSRHSVLESEASEKQSLLGYSERESRVGEFGPEGPENQLGLEEQNDEQALEEPNEYERANFTPAIGAPSTEIAETPQVARTHNLFDISSDPQLQTPDTNRLKPTVAAPRLVELGPVPEPAHPAADASKPSPRPPQPRAGSSQPDVSTTRPAKPTLPAVAEDSVPAPHSPAGSRESSLVRLDNKSYQKQPSKLKRQRQSLQATPALRPIWSPPRTRLSLGNRSGLSIVQVSKSDQEILLQAGLKPTLRRLSEAHGFTVDVIASVYQDMGSLKETEAALEKMKRSADKIRVDLVRRKSFRGSNVEVLHGEVRPLGSSDDENDEESGDYRDWDTSRTGGRILFGDQA